MKIFSKDKDTPDKYVIVGVVSAIIVMVFVYCLIRVFKNLSQNIEVIEATGVYNKNHSEGRKFFTNKEYTKALESFKKCESLPSNDSLKSVSHLSIGMCYFFTPNYDECYKHLTISIDLDSKNDLAYDFRSKCNEILGRYKEAIDDLIYYDRLRVDKSETETEKIKERRIRLNKSLEDKKGENIN